MKKKIITRFAPSPTGFLHVGGLRTALYNYLFAKQNKGEFLLRIEDTDRARLVKGAEENIKQTLTDFGLNWQGEIVRQSERLDIYKKYAQEFLDKNLAYSDEGAVRFKMPKQGGSKFKDLIRGEIEISNADQEDFVILKSDGYPTYNLAHIIDDHEMGVTHVIRGEEFISSMPKYVALHQALSWQLPEYAHLPLLLNKDRSKLSKRQGDVAVEDYLKKGYLPEALLNFVALLGWHPADDEKEIMGLEEMVKEFSFEKVHKSGAVFDLEKLDWMNGHYIRSKDLDEITKLCLPYLKITKEKWSFEYIKSVVELERGRLKRLEEIGQRTTFFFFKPEYKKELLIWKDFSFSRIKDNLIFLKQKLESFDKKWDKVSLEKYVLNLIKKENLTNGEVLWPMRAALTGEKTSPGPFEVAGVVGRERTLLRLEKAINLL